MRRKYLVLAAALTAALFANSALADDGWQVGDKVSVWVSGDYYDGSILEVGTGDHDGQYLIDFDQFTSNQYALAKNVVARKSAASDGSSGTVGSNGCRIMVINGQNACDPATVK